MIWKDFAMNLNIIDAADIVREDPDENDENGEEEDEEEEEEPFWAKFIPSFANFGWSS